MNRVDFQRPTKNSRLFLVGARASTISQAVHQMIEALLRLQPKK